jgi:hypothetical protein
MPDFDFIDNIEQALDLIFGGQAPTWLLRGIAILVVAWVTLFILSKIKALWSEHFQTMFYKPEEKRRSARRRRFADHVESEIRRLNNLEEWRDYRFTELEAEVEAEGRRRTFSLLPLLQRTRSGLRRETSLSKALEASRERLILVEGDPGSGKSVALRHVTQSLARQAMKSRNAKSVIPIYINLKELERRTMPVGFAGQPDSVAEHLSPAERQADRFTVFISYNHNDEAEKNAFLSHLGVLRHAGIDVWSDDQIGAGVDWEAEINRAIGQAKVAILLITANFLTSDFILGTEMPAILKHHEREGLIVFPVIARACAWRTVDWLAKMNVRPGNGRPIWSDAAGKVDERLTAIAEEIALIINKTDDDSFAPVIFQSPKQNNVQAIDKHLIQSFVLRSLNRVNDRDIEEFLEEEFERGLKEGTWLFLFDSFDELPEVLSSTEADVTIRNYSDAISDFLHGMNQCRGIIASRQFRGPGQSGWPRFRILSLSEERRRELIGRADLNLELEKDFIGQLGTTGHDIRTMASNPMFLGLLCEHVRSGNLFPANAHDVFETYISTRLTRDEERLRRRYRLETTAVRMMAENVAFCLGADLGLGLSPTRDRLKQAMMQLGFTLDQHFETLLDALEYIKLARSETAITVDESKSFTFAHRRFQEYFATCLVLVEPDRVTTRQLLTDARWRETAVVLCQTQPTQVLLPIIEEARHLLNAMIAGLPELIDDPLAYVSANEENEENQETERDDILPKPFPWPAGILHILGLLQDGFGSRIQELPDDVRLSAGRLILSASESGTVSDKKWGLEVAGIVPQPILIWLLRDAFSTHSQWLKEVAYRQAARLGKLPADISRPIRQSLIALLGSGRLQRERHATRAHLTRLDQSISFLSILRLLFWIPGVDLGLHVLVFFSLLIVLYQEASKLSSTFLTQSLILIPVFLLISYQSLNAYATIFTGLGFPGQSFSVFVALMVRYFRFCALFLIFVIPWPLKAFLFVFVVWDTFALLSVRTGQFVRPIWWPFMPIWPLLYFVRNANVVAATLARMLRRRWRVWVLLTLVIVVPCGWISSAGYLQATFPTLYPTYVLFDNVFRSIFFAGIIGIYLIAIPPFLFGVPLIVFYFGSDLIRWLKWRYSQHSSMTASEFLDILSQYYSINLVVPFGHWCVRAVREQGLLAATQEAEVLIEQLAVTLERDQKLQKALLKRRRKHLLELQLVELTKEVRQQWISGRRRRKGLPDPELDERISKLESAEFKHWYRNYTRKNLYRLAAWGPELLDEISRLLEQVRANSHD